MPINDKSKNMLILRRANQQKNKDDDEESSGLFSFGPAQGSKQRICSHAAFTSRKAIGASTVGNLYPTILGILAILSIFAFCQSLPNHTRHTCHT